MMKTIGAIEAEGQFSNLLDRAEHGEEIVVTRDGEPVVRISPFKATPDPAEAREAFRQLREYARQNPIPGITREEILSWIAEGRR